MPHVRICAGAFSNGRPYRDLGARSGGQRLDADGEAKVFEASDELSRLPFLGLLVEVVASEVMIVGHCR